MSPHSDLVLHAHKAYGPRSGTYSHADSYRQKCEWHEPPQLWHGYTQNSIFETGGSFRHCADFYLKSLEKVTAPFFERLRNNLPWWESNTSNPHVLEVIKHGVVSDYPLPKMLSKKPCFRTQKETQLALQTIQEYLEVGAVEEIPPRKVRHLIPWFVIEKGDKLRLITDCREINHYLEPKPFKLENLGEMFPFLRKGSLAA